MSPRAIDDTVPSKVRILPVKILEANVKTTEAN